MIGFSCKESRKPSAATFFSKRKSAAANGTRHDDETDHSRIRLIIPGEVARAAQRARPTSWHGEREELQPWEHIRYSSRPPEKVAAYERQNWRRFRSANRDETLILVAKLDEGEKLRTSLREEKQATRCNQETTLHLARSKRDRLRCD